MLIGIGVVLGIVCAACGALLVGLGVLSSSTLLALLHRRVSTGLRALHYQLAMLAGLLSGAPVAWLAGGVLCVTLRQRDLLLLGAAGGMAAAVLLALVADYVVHLVYRRLSASCITREISVPVDE